MSIDPEMLSLSYRYPFSNEAKAIVNEQAGGINIKYLDMAARHIDNATTNGIEYKDISISSVKLDYIMTYLYSRMILSAVKRKDLIALYAAAEAKRSCQAMLGAETSEIVSIAAQFNIRITSNTFDKRKAGQPTDELSINFIDYIKNSPKGQNFELVNQRLSGGIVLLEKNSMTRIMEQAAVKEITKGLPIKSTDLPKEVITFSKGLAFRSISKPQINQSQSKNREEWIERLLQTPIADVRHRTVNLILAPYLVNTKGLEVEQAEKIIWEYIERCKQIDPETKINESYIRYQCTYAKRRGLKPLSLDRAKELLGSQVDLESQIATR